MYGIGVSGTFHITGATSSADTVSTKLSLFDAPSLSVAVTFNEYVHTSVVVHPNVPFVESNVNHAGNIPVNVYVEIASQFVNVT
ncbi:MAG: hypothetical protein GY827_03360 [Cytophagales bacterium]|nr:hypothetical protein [Cytophagales bacterium]